MVCPHHRLCSPCHGHHVLEPTLSDTLGPNPVTPLIPQATLILVCITPAHGAVGVSPFSLGRWLPTACQPPLRQLQPTESNRCGWGLSYYRASGSGSMST
ncbi:hypothetical protein GOODEAATRI_012551 [Goodea atripinnis]|uniref:Uncharacterized protein n=1 Tax=Goodea atripinnis TaxID=208336 RepID=A0ABV0NA37_9TELE